MLSKFIVLLILLYITHYCNSWLQPGSSFALTSTKKFIRPRIPIASQCGIKRMLLLSKPSGKISESLTNATHIKGVRRVPKNDVIEATGIVVESLPSAVFKVELDGSKRMVLATVCGKIRKNNVRIIVGDSVAVEVSVYDISRGRIVYRNRS